MARSEASNRRMRDTRREAILNTALQLFASRGLTGTKISDIASAVGMSQGLLYHYFESKEAIYTELIRDAFEKMNAACRALEAGPLPPEQKIRKALSELLRSIEQNAIFASTVLLIVQAGISEATPDEARQLIATESHVPYQVIERILSQGQLEGVVPRHDPAMLSLLFWITIKGLAMHRAVYASAYRAPDPDVLAGLFLVPQGSINHADI